MKKLKLLPLTLLMGLFLISCNTNSQQISISSVEKAAKELSAEPARPAGQTDVIGLACDPIPTVRVGFVGLGMRGKGAVRRFLHIDGIEVKALCDLEQFNLDIVKDTLANYNVTGVEEYTGEDGWKKLCERDDIDLVYICTHWGMHTPIAVYAMEQGKHVAIEVPAAQTIEECWQLVNTAEKTRRHCMQLENCCYGEFELNTLNMAQKGLFGEIVHAEGAYIHDLRRLNFSPRLNQGEAYEPGVGAIASAGRTQGPIGYWDQWRLKENTEKNGNLYPTHGFGPVCQALNIHRGDKLDHLVSLSSNQFSMTEYAKEKFGADSEEAKRTYKEGDMNISLIKTAKGKSIMVQHDVALPRQYSRIHMLSGTKGFALQFPVHQIILNGEHRPLNKEDMEKVLKENEHPFITELGDKARRVGGHGGMDYVMDYRLVYCLRNGLPLDQDVYDAAEWSCITPLSEFSVANGSYPVKVPDFTRGAWQKQQGYKQSYK